MIGKTMYPCEKLKNKLEGTMRYFLISLLFPWKEFFWVALKKIVSQKIRRDG